jgi:ribosomal RNA-processing protein 7
MKQKKQMKLKSSQTDSDDMLELLTSKKDETKLKNKKKSKKNLKEGSNPVEEHQSLSDRINAGTPKLKKDRRSSDEPNNADEVLHGNQDEETPTARVNQLTAESGDMDIGEPEEVKRGNKSKTKKTKKSGKSSKKDKHESSRENKLDRHGEVDTANVDEIQSVDEDCSRGMKSNCFSFQS